MARGIFTLDDLFDRCVVCPLYGCWLWAGADDGRDGYGRVLPPGRGLRTPEATHRFCYRMFKTPGRRTRIPAGFDVDHLCRHWFLERPAAIARKCVLPDHLEAVRPAINHERRRLDKVWERIRAEYAAEQDYLS